MLLKKVFAPITVENHLRMVTQTRRCPWQRFVYKRTFIWRTFKANFMLFPLLSITYNLEVTGLSCIMPPRSRCDLSDDLKGVIVRNVNRGMPYREVAQLTGVSLGAIAALLKVTVCL